MPAGENQELLAGVVQSGRGYRIVPVGYILPYQGRPCRSGILVEVIHDKYIHWFSCERAADSYGLETALIADYLTLVGIASVATALPCWMGRGRTCKSRLWKQLMVGILVHDTLEFAVELACLGGIV